LTGEWWILWTAFKRRCKNIWSG